MSTHPLLRILAAALLASTAGAQSHRFVDANLTTGANNGSSWADAFQGSGGLQLAMTTSFVTEIWVAQGTYIPTRNGARNISFTLKSGLEIYGGFAGGETLIEDRPAFGLAPSLLSGDLAGDDDSGGSNAENSYHVLDGGTAFISSYTDGFIVKGGFANGLNADSGGGLLCSGASTSPQFGTVRFEGNHSRLGGGAVHITDGASPRFYYSQFIDNSSGLTGGAIDMVNAGFPRYESCLFQRNFAGRGGALDVLSTLGTFTHNCVFYKNTATGTDGGGAIRIGSGGMHRIFNCTVLDNQSSNQAQGGLLVQGSTVEVSSSIFWDNSGQSGAQGSINQIGGTVNVSYCIVAGGFIGTGNNISDNPNLADPTNGNFSLPSDSPAIDAGDSSTSTIHPVTFFDYNGNRRTVDVTAWPDTGNPGTSNRVVDIGAVERQDATMSWIYCNGRSLCPCGNGTNQNGGCANSTGSGAQILLNGRLRVGVDDFGVVGFNLAPNQPAILITGTAQASRTALGNGLLCVGGGLVRLGVQVADGSGNAIWATGLAAAAGWNAGDTAFLQIWYRDPNGPCSTQSNLSSARAIVLQP